MARGVAAAGVIDQAQLPRGREALRRTLRPDTAGRGGAGLSSGLGPDGAPGHLQRDQHHDEDVRRIGLVESNPFSRLRLPAVDRQPTMDEYRALIEACTVLGGHGPEFRAMIQFSAWAGVRAGELQALQWDDLEGEAIRM
jgi:integrase